jgi:hypothetical protein
VKGPLVPPWSTARPVAVFIAITKRVRDGGSPVAISVQPVPSYSHVSLGNVPFGVRPPCSIDTLQFGS